MRSSSTAPYIMALLRLPAVPAFALAILFSLRLLTHTTLSKRRRSFDNENASAKLSDYSGTTGLLLVSGVPVY